MAGSSLSLLIVDDEKLTRESLEKYVPWRELGIASVRTARNGLEALALAQASAPEVLLTDVRMPKMDGLELAERVRGLNPACKIVFLSGYADKEYLLKAIDLQAVSYVEKPVDLAEVQEAVRRAVSVWNREAGERREASALRENVKGAMTLLRDEIARGLVRGDRTVLSLAAGADDALRRLAPDTPFTAAALHLRWNAGVGATEKTKRLRQIVGACGGTPPFCLPTSIFGVIDDDTVALIVARPMTAGRPAALAAYEELLHRVRETAAGSCGASIGIGVPVKGLALLPRSFAAAVESLRMAFYTGDAERAFLPVPAAVDRFALPPEDVQTIRERLRGGDPGGAIEAVRALAAEAARLAPRDVGSVRGAFTRINELVPGAEGDFSWFAPGAVEECANLRELCEMTVSRITLAFDASLEQEKLPRKLREARRFLCRHYADPDLSLRAIAEHVGLSRTYLSALYKAATGRSITEELTALRIDRARELLLDPRLKTHEVAARVGYRDSTYFSALFHRRVGRTPTEYRESL